MKKFCFILFSFILTVCYSQAHAGNGDRNQLKGFVVKATVIEGDTLPVVNLHEAVIVDRMVFTNEEEAKKYRILVRDVRRVYPYAVLIGVMVKDCDQQMTSMNKHQKKEFMKKMEPRIKNQFEKVFRNNTVNQAEVLIKLIDRQTGATSHNLIKHYKGSWNAFMWQSVAIIVGTDLKDRYDPNGVDKNIEHIVRQIESGLL
ncbi:MAG: DUF4294 domain-containing protein [Bacteroidia bacterium]|nr:DUF4294 domain-containing protein [Bacteroidia bacterium]